MIVSSPHYVQYNSMHSLRSYTHTFTLFTTVWVRSRCSLHMRSLYVPIGRSINPRVVLMTNSMTTVGHYVPSVRSLCSLWHDTFTLFVCEYVHGVHPYRSLSLHPVQYMSISRDTPCIYNGGCLFICIHTTWVQLRRTTIWYETGPPSHSGR